MTTLTNKEIIKSFFVALKGALEDGSNWNGTGFTVYRYDNMRDYRTEPERPFIFLGSRGTDLATLHHNEREHKKDKRRVRR